MRADDAGFPALHSYFVNRLVPVCDELLRAAEDRDEIRSGVGAFELMYAVGNLCVASQDDARYDARRMVGLLIDGLRGSDRMVKRVRS